MYSQICKPPTTVLRAPGNINLRKATKVDVEKVVAENFKLEKVEVGKLR